MPFIELATQGESSNAIVNTDHIAFVTEGVYGPCMHFGSGEHIVCVAEMDELKTLLDSTPFQGKAAETFLLRETETPQAASAPLET
ncbi:hypothetical protein K3152_11385 [Qipengyuania sp. 1NDH17]|uniref:Uncharacterized protein n=1 Tax=Qipengyuania polymorpha TaxID=2867234 RepID=A0ABS7J0K3_9SPHN|nr:hypothetical protein [Qipengyuania polymorpha]MBX7458849.1 hypothetical protein [Qipengyuania polymorpha]